MTTINIRRREPAFVLVLSIVTLGWYLPFWYYGTYEDIETLVGQTPTGHGYWLDLFLVIVTLGIYGIWVDYRISQVIAEFEERSGFHPVQDTSIIAVILDVAAYMTFWFTNLVTSAIHQDQINRLADKLDSRLLTEAGLTA